MVLRKRPLATGVAALVFSSWVSALGLGEIQLHSALNEPLDAEIRLLNLGNLTETEIIAGLASARDFVTAGIDREPILSELVFSLDLSNPSVPLLRVSSQRPIREPYLDFLVDVRWPNGRLMREYTVLLDLPVYAADQAVRPSPVDSHQPVQWQDQPDTAPPPPRPRAEPPPRVDTPVAAGDEYQVRSGDTLWGIASRLSGPESVHRKMAAIHQLNPAAFINGDINLLRQGEVLRLPDYRQLAEAPAAPATRQPPREEELAPAPQVREPVAAVPRETADQPPAGRLRLSAIDADTANETDVLAPAAGMGAGEALIRGELQDIQDELARTQRENSELRLRLANLEDQIATMQRIMEVSSDDMRAVQLLAGSDTTPSAGASEPPPGAGSPDPEPVASDGAAAPPAPAPAQTQSDKGWFQTVSSYLIYIVGALLVLIAGLVIAVQRKRRQDHYESDDEIFSPRPAASRDSIPATPPPPPPPPVREVPVQPQVSSLDEIPLDEEDDLFARPATSEYQSPEETTEFRELVEPSLEPEPPAAPLDRHEPTPDELDDLELDLSEFELDEPQTTQHEPPPAREASLDEALNLDDFDFLGDADEGETQLGLAQAYLDMGDQASAREILQEVLETGSDTHRERARELLDGLR